MDRFERALLRPVTQADVEADARRDTNLQALLTRETEQPDGGWGR